MAKSKTTSKAARKTRASSVRSKVGRRTDQIAKAELDWLDERARELEDKYVAGERAAVRSLLSAEKRGRRLSKRALDDALANRLRLNLEIFARKDVLWKSYPKNDDVIICEGDSWFDHPFLRDLPEQLGHIFGFAVLNSNKPGKYLSESVNEAHFLAPLHDGRRNQIKALLLSGGGNDVINWHPDSSGVSAIFRRASSENPQDFIDEPNLTKALDEMTGWLEKIAQLLRDAASSIPVLLHCYDYIVPRQYAAWTFKGTWVYRQLIKIGAKKNIHRDIVQILQGQWMTKYQVTCTTLGWHFVSAGNVVKGRWYDEIHPHSIAFQEIAGKIKDQLVALKVHPSYQITRLR